MPNDERTDLLAELATARAALTKSTDGLSDEQAAERPTASALCLGGLVKHVTAMERGWLRIGVDGPPSYALPDGVSWADIMAGTASELPQWMIDYENGFRLLPGETLAGLLDQYERTAEETEKIIASAGDLSATYQLPATPWGEPASEYTLRRVLLHVIAETTQHAGHADILRESLDGKKST